MGGDNPWLESAGIHGSGLHVWLFDHMDGTTTVEFDADARLTLDEARAFAAQLAGLLDQNNDVPGAPAAKHGPEDVTTDHNV